MAHWLVRTRPQLALSLQGGAFDAPDRLFLALADACGGGRGGEPREVVPEFYWGRPEFLEPPPAGVDLGATADGARCLTTTDGAESGTTAILAQCSGEDGQQVFLDYESGELTNEFQADCFGVC